jgi:hypothetical protein
MLRDEPNGEEEAELEEAEEEREHRQEHDEKFDEHGAAFAPERSAATSSRGRRYSGLRLLRDRDVRNCR